MELIIGALATLIGIVIGWAIFAPRAGRSTDLPGHRTPGMPPSLTRPAPPMPRIKRPIRKISRKRNQK